jgi:hypothetical protein
LLELKEWVKSNTLETSMKLVSLFVIAGGLMMAQDSPVSTLVAPLGIPCEPGQALPLGPGFPLFCPPIAEQGAMVFVKTSEEAPKAYRVKVRYTSAEGEAKESEQIVGRNKDGEWTTLVYQIGRLKTADLAGNTVDGVDVEQLADLPADAQPASAKKATRQQSSDQQKSDK